MITALGYLAILCLTHLVPTQPDLFGLRGFCEPGSHRKSAAVRFCPLRAPFSHTPFGYRLSNSANSDYVAYPEDDRLSSPIFSDCVTEQGYLEVGRLGCIYSYTQL